MSLIHAYHISNTKREGAPSDWSVSRPAAASLRSSASYDPALYDQYDYLCKLLVIGDSGCGKSSLLRRFSDNDFQTGYSSTIGVDFEVRTIDVGAKKVKLQMWDTAGQERFRTITSSYYRGAHAVLIVFDVTVEESFGNVRRWLHELQTVQDHSAHATRPQILLIANKVDLVRQRVVETHRVEELAAELHVPFLETSAKSNTNVLEAFQAIGSAFLKQRMKDEVDGKVERGGPGGKKDFLGVSIEDGSEVSGWKKCMGACSIM